MTINKRFLTLLCFTTLSLFGYESKDIDDLVINLKEPVFSHGVIQTDQGGIIRAPGLRIQAQKISYVNRIENGHPIQKVVAEGNLLLEYQGQFFVGDKLEFDFHTRTGMVTEGRTYTGIWFVGGKKFELNEDGSFVIHDAYFTSSENMEKTWNIDANRININKEKLLTAENIRFRFFKIPVFWIPSFKTNLKIIKNTPARYKVIWDKGLGPRVSGRWRVFSSEYSDVYFRADYRLSRGPGVALESEYYSNDTLSTFLTKNYVAHDKTVPDESGQWRYRFQGLFHTQSKDEWTYAHMTWDKLRDDKMPGDFKNDDFEINTQLRTILDVHHTSDLYTGNFRVQPRINSFQSLTQMLPLARIGVHPLSIGRTGIIVYNNFQAGYLDYSYAGDLTKVVKDFDSVRIETDNTFYRPIHLNPVVLTPNVGYVGIFYSKNPQHDTVMQNVLGYGVDARTRVFQNFSRYCHIIEPYLAFQGLSHPTVKVDKYFIFNIDDGYAHINMFKVGVKQSFFSRKRPSFAPTMVLDLFSYAFFHEKVYHTTFPKVYGNFDWNLRNLNFHAYACWNVNENVLDYSNFLASWTVNEDFAIAVEYRHRSKFDWRKSNHDNFVMDFARTLDSLLHSPISDGRNTALARFELRLTPQWSVHYQAHAGWGRRNEPNYNSQRVDLVTLFSTHWKGRVSYEHMPNDDRFTYDIKLVK